MQTPALRQIFVSFDLSETLMILSLSLWAPQQRSISSASQGVEPRLIAVNVETTMGLFGSLDLTNIRGDMGTRVIFR